jgi:hypothetical protein
MSDKEVGKEYKIYYMTKKIETDLESKGYKMAKSKDGQHNFGCVYSALIKIAELKHQGFFARAYLSGTRVRGCPHIFVFYKPKSTQRRQQ